MHEIVRAPSCPFSQLPEPTARFRHIAFTGERPPREGAANPREQSSGDRPVSQAVQRQRAAADADEQTRDGEPLARPVPAAAIPDAGRRTMCRQIQSVCFGHGLRRCKFGDMGGPRPVLMGFPTRDVTDSISGWAWRAASAVRLREIRRNFS